MIDIDQLLEEEELQIQESKNQDSNNDSSTKDTTPDELKEDTTPDNDSDSSTDENEDDDTSTEDAPEVDEDAKAYFEFLKAEQVLDIPDDFDFKGDSASIQEALSLTKRNVAAKVASQIWNSLPDDFKPILEYGLNGGKDLQEYLKIIQPTDVENLDLDDDISRKAVITSYYKILNPKIDDAQIKKRIDKLTEIADLEEEAKDAIEYLKTYKEEQKNAFILEAKARQEQEIEQAKKELDTFINLIDKQDEFDSNRKNRLKQFLLSPTTNNTTGFESALDAIYEIPEHKVQLANILADYDPKIGFNFDRLHKKLQTKATKSFKELINSKLDTKSQVKGSNKPSTEEFNWDEFFTE